MEISLNKFYQTFQDDLKSAGSAEDGMKPNDPTKTDIFVPHVTK